MRMALNLHLLTLRVDTENENKRIFRSLNNYERSEAYPKSIKSNS